jgi:CRP-like cAMP-binding protein
MLLKIQIEMKPFTDTDSQYICEIDAPCFKSLSQVEMDLIQNSKTQVSFRKGENLTKQGTFVSYVLFVLNGLSRQYIEGYGGKNYNISIIQPGEFVGLAAVFDRSTFSYTTTAITDTQAALIEKEAIAQVMRANGEFSFDILKRYCKQNSSLFDSLDAVMFKQINGRMASTILYLNKLKDVYPDLHGQLSRKDLADFAGTTVETAVKVLKGFEKDRYIQLNDKEILILNLPGLIELSRLG